LAIQSVFPERSGNLLQGQPAKKKIKKIRLTQHLPRAPRHGTPPPLTASRKRLKLHKKMIQALTEKIP
jgi:hypothetical protein